jgi:hypothetical protein
LGDIVIHAILDNGQLTVGTGPLAERDLVIETGPAIAALLDGRISPAAAAADGSVRLTGRRTLLARFIEAFSIPERVSR